MGGGGLYVEAPGKETPRLRLGRLPGECGQLKVLEPGLEAWTPGSACCRPSAGAGWARHAVPRRAHSGRLQDWPQRAATHLIYLFTAHFFQVSATSQAGGPPAPSQGHRRLSCHSLASGQRPAPSGASLLFKPSQPLPPLGLSFSKWWKAQ